MRAAPVQRVRARLEATVGATASAAVPRSYQRVGRVLIVQLPESARPHFQAIGESYRAEFGVATVLRRAGPMTGEWRLPVTETIAGDGAETEVLEHGIRYRFDAARLMFSRGNQSERKRAGDVTRPGETVVDLFAGIGYFTLPAAVIGRAARVIACEGNPLACSYLASNVRRNGVPEVVEVVRGDNRTAPVPHGIADRVFLGWLPNSLPWVSRALELVRREGATLHVHVAAPAQEPVAAAERDASMAVAAAGGIVESLAGRVVKPYGPGRTHVVVDVRARPPNGIGG
ncbi:MAG TPA: class I SAM-dependent methyltransferase family protein [Thermoplasmata archaeon]|nr:class I SAM-dependent methyltransferase family protein [Thermoplasmata archaeon]